MIRFGRVVAVHPSRHTVDLVDQATGWPVAECKVIGDSASDSGSWKVPHVERPDGDQTAPSPPATGRVLIAAYSLLEGSNRGVVHGFVAPDNAQTGVTQDNRSIDRHASGAYTTTAPDGSIEVYHPSGAYFRIGTGGHEALGSISADGTWEEATSASAPTITLSGAGFSLVIDPSGNATMTCTKLKVVGPVEVDGDINATGEVTAKFGGASVTLSQHLDPQGGPPIPHT